MTSLRVLNLCENSMGQHLSKNQVRGCLQAISGRKKKALDQIGLRWIKGMTTLSELNLEKNEFPSGLVKALRYTLRRFPKVHLDQ